MNVALGKTRETKTHNQPPKVYICHMCKIFGDLQPALRKSVRRKEKLTISLEPHHYECSHFKNVHISVVVNGSIN